MFRNHKISRILVINLAVFLASLIFLHKAFFSVSPTYAAATNLSVATGCYGEAGFVKFEWGASSTLIGDYWLDVRVPGGSWPDATNPGQNVGTGLTYTWGGLSGVAPIGGFTPGQAYEWRIWDGTTHAYGNNFTAPSCSGGGSKWQLGFLPQINECTFAFSIADPSGTPGAGHNSTLGILEAGYVSSVIPDGATEVSYSTTQSGSYTAVLLLYTVEISNKVTFTAPNSCKTWNDPGPLPPPFDIMDVFQPAKRFGSFGQLASDVLLILVSLAGALALIFIVISGFKFVTSSGDEKKLASARATLTYAIIGIAVVILAFVIVQILQYFLQSSIPIT